MTVNSVQATLAGLRAAARRRVIGAGISRSASGRAGCLIRLSIKLTAAPDGLMLALVSSRWQRPSHLNFGQTLMRCGCLSLPDPRAIGWCRRRVLRGRLLRAHTLGVPWGKKSHDGWSKHNYAQSALVKFSTATPNH